MKKNTRERRQRSASSGLIIYSLFRLSKVFLICLFIFILTLVLLFTIGNFQFFLDESQILILQVLSYTCIVSLALEILQFAMLPVLIIKKRFKFSMIWSYIWSIFQIVFSIAGIIFSQSVYSLSSGI